MRIVLLTTTLEGGGAARVLVNMANYWAETNWSVSIISFEDGSSSSFYPIHENVRVKYLGLNRFSSNVFEAIRNNWNRLVAIRTAVLQDQPDVLVSFIDTANVRSLLAMLGAGIPVVVSERVHPAYEKIGLLWEILRRMTYPLAARLVVQTNLVASYCRQWVFGEPVVIPNPVQTPESGDNPPELSKPYFLAVGRLYPQKGYASLLKAFASVAKKNPDWSLFIAGEGPSRKDIERLIQELELGSRVRLLGQQSDIGGLLDNADGFVMSSLYEGFPNALCEAMAKGLACVSTDCPSGPSDIINDNVDGLLVPVGDTERLAAALDSVMSDRELRERLGAAAVGVLARFSVKSIMDQWEACICDILVGKGRAS